MVIRPPRLWRRPSAPEGATLTELRLRRTVFVLGIGTRMNRGRIRIRRVDARATPADALVCPADGAFGAGAPVARGIAAWAAPEFSRQKAALGPLPAGTVALTAGLG